MNPNTPDDPTRPGDQPDSETDAAAAAAEADAQAAMDAELREEMEADRAAEAAEDAAMDHDGDADPATAALSPLEALEVENTDLKDRLIRAVAEMENLRKRTEKEKTDVRKFAISKFAEDLLSVSDTMERAVSAVPTEARESDQIKSVVEGIELTQRSLMNIMERHGVQRIEAAGQKFDPNQHQAVMETEDQAVAKGMVIEVAANGYLIGDRVLRPAMVVVSKGPGANPESAAEPAATADPAPEKSSSGRPTLSLKTAPEADSDTSGDTKTQSANDNPDPDVPLDPA